MNWNNVSVFFASEFNSLNVQQIIVTFIFQCSKIQKQIFKVKKVDLRGAPVFHRVERVP